MHNIDEEVSGLIDLAYDKSATSRTELFTAISDLLERRHKDLSDTELSLMSDIIGNLMHTVEMSVREKLAERLADKEDAPIDLVMLLANDQIEVAQNVLSVSKVLTDDNLVRIIRHRTIQHQLSIAGRENVSTDISRELVKTNNDSVVVTLLSNQDAKIDNDTIATIVEKSRNNVKYQPPLVERKDLPKEMAAKMYGWISDSLKANLLKTHSLSEAEIEQILSSAVENLQQEDENRNDESAAEERLVDKLSTAGRLQPSFLMKSLSQGQASLFELAFAKMLDVSHENMCVILYDKGSDVLATACCAVNIDQSVFLTIYRLTRSARGMETNLSNSEINGAFDLFRKLTPERAQTEIKKLVAQIS